MYVMVAVQHTVTAEGAQDAARLQIPGGGGGLGYRGYTDLRLVLRVPGFVKLCVHYMPSRWVNEEHLA